MLEINNIRFGYLNSIDFCFSYSFDLKCPVVINGPSGSGKSTLLSIIAGLEIPVSGSIIFNNDDILALSPSAKPVSILFQSGNLFDHISCVRNVELGLNGGKGINPEFRAIIDHIFDSLGIYDLKKKLPTEISGGQRKRVALARIIARARCIKKNLILLDEPFNGLDKVTKMACINVLLDIKEKEMCKIIIVSHDINDPLEIGANTVALDEIKVKRHS